jgi:drug/metabolite transporter (DMT)-like permease
MKLVCAAAGYTVLLCNSKSERSQRRLSVASCVLWLATVCWVCSTLLNSNIESKAWNVVIFSIAFMLLVVGLAIEVWETHVERKIKGMQLVLRLP